MKIQTKWFGEIDTTEDKIITFEKGIIGFEDFKKFTIVVDAEKESENTIMWLQSAEEPSLALPIIKPEIVKEDYDPIVEDELIKSLGEDIENAYLAVYVTITVPSDLTKMTCGRCCVRLHSFCIFPFSFPGGRPSFDFLLPSRCRNGIGGGNPFCRKCCMLPGRFSVL